MCHRFKDCVWEPDVRECAREIVLLFDIIDSLSPVDSHDETVLARMGVSHQDQENASREMMLKPILLVLLMEYPARTVIHKRLYLVKML